MRRSDKYTSMLVFLEKEQHRKLKEISFANTTFPHRVIVEFVEHLNEKGMPKWLVKECLRGQQISHMKSVITKLKK